MKLRGTLIIAAIAVAAMLSAGMSLSAMSSAPAKGVPVAAGSPGHHAAVGQAAVRYRYKYVRRCRVKRVRTSAGKIVRRRVCRRVRIRVKVIVPVPPVTTPTVATVPTAPGTTTTTPTVPGTTTTGTTTAPGALELTVREFIGPSGLTLTLSSGSVPAGTYTVKREVDGAASHTLDVRPTGAGAAVAAFGLAGNGTRDQQTVVLTPGPWTFRCTVPGHGAMTATLTVTA